MGREHTIRIVAWGLWVAAAAVLLAALYIYDVRGSLGAAGLAATLGMLLLSQALRLQWLARRLEGRDGRAS